MAKLISVEEAITRAEQSQKNRLQAIREVAHARATLAERRDQHACELIELQKTQAQQIGELERADAAAYAAAEQAGWSRSELQKIGFPKPETASPRRSRKPAQATNEGEQK